MRFGAYYQYLRLVSQLCKLQVAISDRSRLTQVRLKNGLYNQGFHSSITITTNRFSDEDAGGR